MKDLGLSNRNTLFPKETTEGNDDAVDEKEEDEKEEDTKEDDMFTPEEGRIANFTKETKQENEKQEDKIIGDPITAKEAGFVFDETGDLITAEEADRIANLEKDTEEGNENKGNEKEDVITVEDSGLSGRIANSANDTKEENEKEGDMYTAKKEEKPDRNASLTNFKDTKEENKQLQEDVIYKFFKKADTQNLGFLTISQFAAAVRKQGFSGKDSEITTMFLDLDANRDCEVTLEEYMDEMGKRDFRFLTEADWLDIFRKFDRNKDGYVTREELQMTLEERNMRQLEIDMDEVMKKADKDGDGKLSFDDFIKSCGLKSH